MPILKLYKDKKIENQKDLVSIENCLIKMMKTELNANLENCQIIWIESKIFVSKYKIYGELLLRKNEKRTSFKIDNFLTKTGKKLSNDFVTNIRLRAFSLKDKMINAVQIKLREDND